MSSLRLAKLTQLMKEAQKQQVVTKSFGQRVDLYPNFNIFNDMKDSIYVEQEGRTVGDVEVLPGKTLSGCLTNSNLTVRFMGGKDSKVIDSNELRTLIPSLTVKAGELSPTLDISKVLTDISIKKFNSVNKLAEMRKVAETPLGPIGTTEPVNLPEIILGETKDGYIQRAGKELTGRGVTDEELGKHYDYKTSASTSSGANSSIPVQKPQAPRRAPVKHTEVIKQDLWKKTVKDNAGYTFEIGSDGTSLTYSKNNSPAKTLNQTYGNWPQLVKNIDVLTPVAGSDSAATPAAQTNVPAATTPTQAEQTKTEAQKPAEATRQFNPGALAGVKAVLIRAAKPGGFGLSVGTAANERGRIQRMIATISSSEGASIDAYDFLTKMLLVSPRGDDYLTAFFRDASQADIDAIMTSPRKDVVANPRGGKYNRQVAAVLSVLNEVYDGDFSEDNTKAIKDFKAKYVKKEASKLNNDITKTSSKVDPKIKKLATLRRLRVRSQMEEATESATRFGRSRIS
jgi:hypothetical protein